MTIGTDKSLSGELAENQNMRAIPGIVNTYKLTLEGDGISIVRDITVEELRRIMNLVLIREESAREF